MGHFISIQCGLSDWREYLTLPNILKNFNPHIYGYSTQKGLYRVPNNDALNVAESGAEADQMVSQARELVRRMKTDRKVDFRKDWKMVTLLVGHNDICSHSCRTALEPKPKDVSPKVFVKYVTKALDILYKKMPRTFVNLVPTVDVSTLFDVIDKPFPCRPIHTFSCPCLFDRKTTRPHSRASVQKILDKYLRGLERVVNSGRYDGKKDFTVVLQPFTINARLPKARSGGLDLRFLSPDCFHWGQRTHAAAARSLWNNLLEPVGDKTASFMIGGPFLCPTEEQPFLATAKNSGRRADEMKSFSKDYYDMMKRTGPVKCPL